mmetsp:Transcript_16001/g.15408  ORF Transcript_16001/g.15408 Transcript_16001/m.15408 type:complete len:119 (+) Transcript_16001:585-941(+)
MRKTFTPHGQNFIRELKKQNITNNSLFSISLANSSEGNVTFIEFGDYQTELTNHFTFVWIYLRSTLSILWEINLNAFTYGKKAIELSVTYATFDTGSSLIYMPEEDFQQIYSLINENN